MSLGSASNFFLGAASASGGSFELLKSVRFNPSDNAYLNRTPSSSGNQKTYTISFWTKLCDISSNTNYFLTAGSGSPGGLNSLEVGIDLNNRLFISEYGASLSDYFIETTTAYLRDPSGWYHFVIAVNTTESSATDRIKFYVNGVEQTKEATSYPFTLNRDTAVNSTTAHTIGSDGASDLNGYLADFYFIDGSAEEPSSFGSFDTNNVWRPKLYTGTYGTNGYHLFDFANESGVGDDSSGNDNDWTVNNIEGPGNGTQYRTLELSENHPSGSVAQKDKAFDATYIATYVNTSTWAITNTAWAGAYSAAYAELLWTPTGGYEVSSSLRVYYGCYDNTTKTTTLTITYTDASTETDSMTSGSNNWMKLYTASSAAGKTIQKIGLSVSTPSATNTQFGGFVIDDAIVESLNVNTDILRDVPTNGDSSSGTGAGGEVSGNYATLNSNHINSGGSVTLSQGNLRLDNGATSTWNSCPSTIVLTSGKWLCEVTVETPATYPAFGVSNPQRVYPDSYLGQTADSWVWFAYSGAGLFTNGSYTDQTSPWDTKPSAGDVIGMALDLDGNTLKYYKNGTLLGTAFTNISGPVVFADGSNASTINLYNFGQRLFAYPVDGYKAVCTANISTPTIADGSKHFDAQLWSGDTSVSTNITGYNFAPDFVWIKNRSSTEFHIAFDIIRGAAQYLYPSLTNAENDGGSNTLTAFNSDGFTLYDPGGWQVNMTGKTYVGWAWDAGTSTESNIDGTITSQVRANQSAGFSIVSFNTGATSSYTVGHGLNAKPHFMIFKDRDTAGQPWTIYHDSLGSSKYLLFSTAAEASASWGGDPTSSVFYAGSTFFVNNVDVIGYCFAPVAGYSAFGVYVGDGVAGNGTNVMLDFAPAFVMIKNTTTAANWVMWDSKRPGYNLNNDPLYPNLNDAEGSSYRVVDFLSNGFKLRDPGGDVTALKDTNSDGDTFIYAAFAENPFQANGGLAR